jgi:Fe-S cluster assembly protein SufD
MSEIATMNVKDQFLSTFGVQDFHFDTEASKAARDEATKRIEGLDFPTSKNEYWKYTRINRIVKAEYRIAESTATIDITPFLIEGLEKNVMVFVNGFYRADLSTITSQDGVIACALSEAKEKHAAIFDAYFSKHIVADEIFANINTAFHQDGAFIHFAKKQKADHPIHILNLIDGDQIITNPRNLIIGEAFSEGKVLTSYHNLNGGKSFTNAVNECFAAENSYLEFNKLQEEDGSSFHIATDQVYQEKSGNFTINTFTFNGDIVRNNLNIAVAGENGYTSLNGFYLPKEKQLVDNHTRVDHLVPHCESHELYRGVIDDKATAVFNGKVMVHRDAQKTNAFQANNNVLLSDDATINSKPELEIYADDVKCSHGSTIGQLDEEAIFYLRARGLSEDSAIRLLLNAFAADVLQHVGIESFRLLLEEKIENGLKK